MCVGRVSYVYVSYSKGKVTCSGKKLEIMSEEESPASAVVKKYQHLKLAELQLVVHAECGGTLMR